MKTILIGLLAFAGLAASAPVGTADAQTQSAWPTRPVRFILPAVPGGGSDTLARTLQPMVQEKLGQPLILDNRPSQGFILSTDLVAKSTDGHTIGMLIGNTHAANHTVQSKLPYRTLEDITAIINLNSSPNIIAVHPSFPATSLAELIAAAKAQPGKLFYATSGVAGGQHFAGEMLKSAAGIDMVHVPYKGTGASLKDALSGEIKIIFGNVISAGPHVASGALRGLAITSSRRSPLYPDIPTVGEQGFPQVDLEDTYGIFGPASMPAEVVKKVHDAFRDAMISPDLAPRLKQQGVVAHILGPEDYRKYLVAEIEKLGKIAREASIKAE